MPPLAARARALLTPTGVFALLVPIALILIVWFGRDTIPLLDEWTWISDRRPWTWHVFFEPHNDHLSVVPLAVYKLLMATAGLGDHAAYRIVLAAFHGLCATLVFLLVRRRLGGWEAAVAGGVVLFLGSASDDLLWAFQISFLGTVAGGLGAWLALERGDRRGDVLAGLCLAFAIANSSLGLPIAAGILVELVLRGGLRQRRLLVVIAPLAAYLPWYLVYGQSKTRYDSLGQAAHWALDVASSAFGGFAGGGLKRGRLILGAFVIFLVFALVRGWRPSPRAAGLATAAVLFWGLTALARQNIQPATTSRYIYLGAVLMVLLFAELLRDVPRPAWAIAGAAVLAMIGAGLNFRELSNAADYLRLVSSAGRAELGAMELAGRAAPPKFIPRDEFVQDGAYLDAIADLGSPAVAPRKLAGLGLDNRRRVDLTLQQVGSVSLSLHPRGKVTGTPPPVIAVRGGTTRIVGDCVEVRAAHGGRAVLEVKADRRLLLVAIDAPVEISAARFGDGGMSSSLGTASTAGRVELVTRPDALTAPRWRARLTTSGRAGACPFVSGAAPHNRAFDEILGDFETQAAHHIADVVGASCGPARPVRPGVQFACTTTHQTDRRQDHYRVEVLSTRCWRATPASPRLPVLHGCGLHSDS